MNKFAILREFWEFLRVRKKTWLRPIVAVLLILGLLLALAKGSAPRAIYLQFVLSADVRRVHHEVEHQRTADIDLQ